MKSELWEPGRFSCDLILVVIPLLKLGCGQGQLIPFC